MLVLSREKDQAVYIDGEKIKITIVDIIGNRVRLGIDAPPHMPVYREELYKAIQRGQQASGVANPVVESLGGRKDDAGKLEGEVEK